MKYAISECMDSKNNKVEVDPLPEPARTKELKSRKKRKKLDWEPGAQ